MRTIWLLTLCLTSSCLVSCADNDPTAPQSRAAETPVSGNGADQGWQRVTFFNDRTLFVPCVSEDVRIYGFVIYWYHQVAAPSGGFDVETPKAPIFTAVGLTSGKVFVYQYGGPLSQAFHVAVGGVQNVLVNEKYMASDRTTLIGDATFRFTVSGNGDLTIANNVEYALSCK